MNDFERFALAIGLTMDSKPCSMNPSWGGFENLEAAHFTVTFEMNGKTFSTFYSMGSGHKSVTPRAERLATVYQLFGDWTVGKRMPRFYGAGKDSLRAEAEAACVYPDPDIGDVLSCLAQDASCVVDVMCFEDFAEDLGYDPDSRAAERIYRNTVEVTRKLRIFLGSVQLGNLLMIDPL